MNARDQARAYRLAKDIKYFDTNKTRLPGLAGSGRLDALVAQFIDSLRRIEFAHHIRDALHDPARMDPSSAIFDPLRAAVLQNRRGEIAEAWWLVFLATHFGKHSLDGWRLTRDIYGRLGQGALWNWAEISRDPTAFHNWLLANEKILEGGDGTLRRFSNHRKYESLKASSKNGTSVVLTSYVNWMKPFRSPAELVCELHKSAGQDPRAIFSALYSSMTNVNRFGRLGKFDYLAMLGKLDIAPVEPGSAFLMGATGPLAGARLLFCGNSKAKMPAKKLELLLSGFSKDTGLGFQVLEDALCNWQKSPSAYVRFRG